MQKRRLILGLGLLVVVVVLVLVVIYGIPLVQAMFTPAITGLPPTPVGNSLQARFTQTALAKTTPQSPSGTPTAAPK